MANRGLYGLPSNFSRKPGRIEVGKGVSTGPGLWIRNTSIQQVTEPNGTNLHMNGRVGTNGSAVLDRLMVFPFPILRGFKYTQWGISVSTAATGGSGSVCRVGLYKNNDTNFPGELIADGGTIGLESTGVKTVAIDYIDYYRDWLWVAICMQVSVAALVVRGMNHNGGTIFGGTFSSTGELLGAAYSLSSISGAFPQVLSGLARFGGSSGNPLAVAY